MKKNKITDAILTGAAVMVGATGCVQQGSTFNERIVDLSREIRPFHVHYSDEALTDLGRWVLAINWPDHETVNNLNQGLQLETMKAPAHYWGTENDWRKIEAKLNSSSF